MDEGANKGLKASAANILHKATSKIDCTYTAEGLQ